MARTTLYNFRLILSTYLSHFNGKIILSLRTTCSISTAFDRLVVTLRSNMGILVYYLQNFYKNEFNRKEMYLRYIYKLHDLHLAAENYTEAGFTMKLYADQLGWGSNVLPSDHAHPQQPEWQRKEVLYHKIIDYLDRGKCWEKGIPLCKELAVLYETRLYDYAKLSHVLKLQAKFLDNILTQLRPEPEYFRVGFYGLSFPLFVRVSFETNKSAGDAIRAP